MTTVIKIEDLAKRYVIGRTRQESYTALRDVIMAKVRSLGTRLRHPLSSAARTPKVETLWALNAIDLEIQQGDRVGIIGRNGAGKSTLLKVLSRITEPTRGRVSITGRVASMLEVGTGFHPELTGRENVFLNGAILGMGRSEIRKKFDEIVAFAEVEQFLDMPVKRYSSGMYVRLAFAVAAHLEPEILVVDEVLSVGDLQFQQKCISQMKRVAEQDRTVLFVSHNLAAIENLCSRVCVLDRGELLFDGDVETGIRTYTNVLMEQNASWSFEGRSDRQGSGSVRIVSFEIIGDDGKPVDIVITGKAYTFRFRFVSSLSDVSDLDFSFTIRDLKNVNLFRNNTKERGIELPASFPCEGFIDCTIPRLPLTSGRYGFGFRLLVNGEEADYITGTFAAYFDVVGGDYFGTGCISSHTPLLIDHSWAVSAAESG
jgi:lipopolysaccharide transport system ATP-binding protein